MMKTHTTIRTEIKKIINTDIFNFLFIILLFICICVSCSTQQRGLFSKKTPHEEYEDQIVKAGLKETALGTLWLNAADKGLRQPLNINLPYRETGYFAAEKPNAAGYQFNTRRGEQLNITIITKPATGFALFADLWEPSIERTPKLLAALDTITRTLNYEVKKEGSYLLRLQPELLRSGEYTLTISTAPTLAFPVPSINKPHIGSFWGDARDNGGRKHEGIDIFGKFRTPVVAAADGYITDVRDGGIGGKVIFLRPDNKDYTLYYAHLDSQIAHEGQNVRTGEVIGLMGNTGNAKYTPTHLHFGIYTFGGAVDPLPFVDQDRLHPKAVIASVQQINDYIRNNKSTDLFTQPDNHAVSVTKLSNNNLLYVLAATDNWYKVQLPDGKEGFINNTAVTNTMQPLRKYSLDSAQSLLERPDTNAATKTLVASGTTLNVYGIYNDYYFIKYHELNGWIKNNLTSSTSKAHSKF